MLPEDAPFGPEHALWVNGVLVGMYSRAPGTEATRSNAYGTGGSPCLPNPSADAPRRQVVILWASQTGNAEEFATTMAERLTCPGDLLDANYGRVGR